MDRRQRKTRAAIFDAFNLLLSEKRYSDISVQNIIDRADVGRSTFYSHFETKDELLKEMCTDIFEHVFTRNSAELTHDFSGKQNDIDTVIIHILYHIKDNQRNIIGVLNGVSGEFFLQYFKEYLYSVFQWHIRGNLGSKVPDDFLLNHICGSFVEMIKWWIKNGMKQSPEEMEQYFIVVTGFIYDI